MNTYFKDKAIESSQSIMDNISHNLTLCLKARGLKMIDFRDWMSGQGVKEVKIRRVVRYQSGALQSDEIAALCLAAIYMGKEPIQVFFHKLNLEDFT